MNNLLRWVKGFGFAVSSLIAFSGSSAIALISQDVTPFNNHNVSSFNEVLEKQNILEENSLKIDGSGDINKTQIQDRNTVDKKENQNFTGTIPNNKVLLAGCAYNEDGVRICW